MIWCLLSHLWPCCSFLFPPLSPVPPFPHGHWGRASAKPFLLAAALLRGPTQYNHTHQAFSRPHRHHRHTNKFTLLPPPKPNPSPHAKAPPTQDAAVAKPKKDTFYSSSPSTQATPPHTPSSAATTHTRAAYLAALTASLAALLLLPGHLAAALLAFLLLVVLVCLQLGGTTPWLGRGTFCRWHGPSSPSSTQLPKKEEGEEEEQQQQPPQPELKPTLPLMGSTGKLGSTACIRSS